ncbi:DMT family transporter [Clostridium sp. D2Q-11]|uniref:DMT family transporter n=1 Tax=Anaeromonas frigoriresistens TaxID=2683708 RepID=A0A942USU7_9FIRM|nr:DMT family transporter [Anaeromonas frigoriresistens]MBS4537315.1 DMT family transporter [Anaeromonas frigoriresistens]
MDKKELLTNKLYVVIIALICSILWGSAFPVLKISYDKLRILPEDIYSKILFAGMRFFIASILIFILVVVFLKISIKINKQTLKSLLILGLLQTSLQYFFFYNGLAYTTGIKGSILASSGTFFVVILAHFIYHDDKMNLKKTVGLISGFLGIFLVNWGKGGFNLHFSFRGEGFLIIAGLVSAFGTIIAKKLSKEIHPFIVTAWQMLLGSIVLLVVGISGAEKMLEFTPLTSGLLIYASFLSATAFSLWYALLKYNRAGEITLYKFMIPVSGSFLSVLLIPNEKFTVYMISALVLVASGIIFVNYKRKPIGNYKKSQH